MKRRYIAALLLSCGLLMAQTQEQAEQLAIAELDKVFNKDSLVLSADRYGCWHFDMYIASTREETMQGLMHIRGLPEFTGMIFIYRQPGIRSMWMKNTYIPLDMLFVRGDGTVSSVAQNTTPLSLKSVASIEPVNFVIELNAGTAKRLHLGDSSRILFSDTDESP